MLKKLTIMQLTLKSWITSRLSLEEAGASLVEYALLLALIAVVAITARVFLGGSVHNTLQNVGNNIATP
jgi:Flp pilus assembly pilin Flp